MKILLKEKYDLDLLYMEKSSVGAGSDTYFITCAGGKYVVKYPASSDINHPEAEPELCEYLLSKGIPVCQFLRNKDGHFLTTDESGRQFHVQRFIEGKMYDLNTAPDWLLIESAQMLGKIHTALRDYPGLPIGIGSDFFKYMTPERALESYEKSLQIAERQGDLAVAEDLRYRIGLMQRLPAYEFDLERLTCCATHGDYFISQILCGEGKINAVIDWTTACVHPVVWEIMRSYVYAARSCKEGQIDMDEFLRYVAAYRKFAPLTEYDLLSMARLFYYQTAVCDYYGQYYASTADNRHIYLHQAVFSTKLLHWFEDYVETLTAKLLTEGVNFIQYQFCGALHKEGSRTFIAIPFNVWEETGRKGNIPCRVQIQDQSFECKLLPKGNGSYWIPIAKQFQAELGTQAEYEITLEFIESLSRINHNSPYTKENPIRKITEIEPISAEGGYCGHSCVAVLAGVPLADVVALMGKEKASWSKILEALDYYGISYAGKTVYPKGKTVALPKCCIVYNDGRFLLWFDGVFYGAESVDTAKTVGYREIVVSAWEGGTWRKPQTRFKKNESKNWKAKPMR